MGWSGANDVFDPVAQALIDLDATDELKTSVLGPLIKGLQDGDWDTEDESLEKFRRDPAIVAVFAERGIKLELADEPDEVLTMIREIASRLSDATDEGEYQAVGLIHDLTAGVITVAEAKSELADITFRHV